MLGIGDSSSSDFVFIRERAFKVENVLVPISDLNPFLLLKLITYIANVIVSKVPQAFNKSRETFNFSKY